MDLNRMLQKCRDGQWKLDDLDWNVGRRPMTRTEEMAVVQYFTDMAAIERLAGALFAEQRRLVTDSVLKKIFATFEADEERHAVAAERLADHYNVHYFRRYRISPELANFRPHFLKAIRHVSPEVANVYITAGELMLDVALLRSLNDFVNDEMSNQVMDLINRDESRHIAMDYYMMEYYASDEYQARATEDAPVRSPRERAEAAWSFMNVVYHAKPFMIAVFLNPMQLTDPTGKRIREAFKRMQLLSSKPKIVNRPFPRFLNGLRETYNRIYRYPVAGRVANTLLSRLSGSPGEYMVTMFTEEEAAQASRMSMEELAEEAVQVKYRN